MSHTGGSQRNNLTMKNQTPTAQETSAQPGASPCCALADGSASAPRFHRWRIRKELPDRMFTCCEYNGRIPVTAEHALASPSVREWLGSDKLDEIYHPE